MADIKKALTLKKHTNPTLKVLVEYYCGRVRPLSDRKVTMLSVCLSVG